MCPDCAIETQAEFTPINMGLFIFAPISSAVGSPSLAYRQALTAGHIFSSAGVLIGAQLFLLIAQYLFKLESIPVLDLPNQQIIQMPLGEFQEFIQTITKRSNLSITPQNPPSSVQTTPGISSGYRGFITPLPPETPLIISLYVTSDYSNKLYSPSVWILIPIIAFPGLRGALPMLLISLLATIFVRAVVSPQTTGAKPLLKQGDPPNSFLNFSPEELSRFLSRFGKYFSSN